MGESITCMVVRLMDRMVFQPVALFDSIEVLVVRVAGVELYQKLDIL